MKYSKTALASLVTFKTEELVLIKQRRTKQNQLGFAYQLAYVKAHNKLPSQQPLDLETELIHYVSLQLGLKQDLLHKYSNRQATIAEHQHQIRKYFCLSKLDSSNLSRLEQFIFEQACGLEQTHALFSLVKDFLRNNFILEPVESTLKRLVKEQGQKARNYIFDKLYHSLSKPNKEALDGLLIINTTPYSKLYYLKQVPSRASATAIAQIAKKLDKIKLTGVLQIDISWLNNNLQRWMNRYVRQATASQLRKLTAKKRYAMLVCFLRQHYLDMTDNLVKTYDKVMSQVYNRTQASLATFQTLVDAILDDSIEDSMLRATIFKQIQKNELSTQRDQVKSWLSGKYKDVFTLLVNTRFSYLCRFSPVLLEHLSLERETDKSDSILKAVERMREMNQTGQRKIDVNIPIDFMPKSTQKLILKLERLKKL